MKRFGYLILATMMCSCTSGGFTVTGEVEGVNAGDSVMVFSYFDAEQRLAEGVVAKDGTFTLKGEANEPIIGALVANGRNLIGTLIVESGDITVGMNQRGAVEIAGTRFNDALVRYANESAVLEQKFMDIDSTLPAEEIQEARDAIYDEYREFMSATVKANTDNIFGAYIFASEEFNGLESSEAQARLAEFTPELLDLEFMKNLSESVESMLRTEVGKPYIDIKLTSIDGEQVSISDLLADGKYVLVDFWATWCNPCVAELPHLKEAYAEFAPKGLEIYGVSLDRSMDDWKAMVDSTIPWINVIDNEEVAASTQYAVRTIPTNFLISPEGIIVAKNLRGEDVAKILGENIK
ncbi:MAG: TlpA disulfide reductase family protein [Rikenellaceae bacterium]